MILRAISAVALLPVQPPKPGGLKMKGEIYVAPIEGRRLVTHTLHIKRNLLRDPFRRIG
jgi:hypothetical protein